MTVLSIIILSYNTKELTLKCINSIIKQHKKELENGIFEIIVVDNNSSDDTIATINKQLSTNNKNYLKIVKNKGNYGFSKGNNIGAKTALGKYLLFLNSDTIIEDQGLLGMVELLEKNKNIGIVGGRLINADGGSQPSCGNSYDNLLNLFLMLFGGERLVRFSPKEVRPVDWVSGGALMIRKHLFKKLGGFDENFFMYIEDQELCLRARNLGSLVYFYPNINIIHKKLGSTSREFAIFNIYKGLLYFYKKYSSFTTYLIVKLLLIIKAYVTIIVGEIFNKKNLAATYRKAITAL